MSNPEYLDKTGLDELVSQTKGYVGNKVSKKIDKPVNVLPGKVLQTDSHGDPIWGEAVPQADIVQAVDDWLEENIDPGEAVTLDSTLTQAQAAAQAKAVGDKIDSLKENLVVVDDDEPESDDNVIWVPETPENEVVVPTISELNEVAGTVAKDYADLTFPVKAGTLCRHNYGLYAAKQDIPTQEAWTSGHWSTKTNIADKLDSLSSAFADDLSEYLSFKPLLEKNVYIETQNGNESAYNGWSATDFIPCHGETKLLINTTVATAYNIFYDSSKAKIKGFTLAVGDNTVDVPDTAYYYRISNTTTAMESMTIKTSLYTRLSEETERSQAYDRMGNALLSGIGKASSRTFYVPYTFASGQKYHITIKNSTASISEMRIVSAPNLDQDSIIYSYPVGGGYTAEMDYSCDVNNALYVAVIAVSGTTGFNADYSIFIDYNPYNYIDRVKENVDRVIGNYPAYYDVYMQSKQNTIKSVSPLHGIQFAFITDLHFPYNAGNSLALLQSIRKNTAVNLIICGGDFVRAYGGQDDIDMARDRVLDYAKALYPDWACLRGNHDFTIRTSAQDTSGITETDDYTYGSIISPMAEWRYEVPVPTVNFYNETYHIGANYCWVMTNEKQKIKIIGFCDMPVTNTTKSFGVVNTITNAYARYFAQLLEDTNGYNVIVATHAPMTEQLQGGYDNHLTTIIEAFANKTAATWGNYNVDFSNNTAVLVCCISGHNHTDQSAVVNNVLHINSTCDASYNDDGYNRQVGTVTEQAFDVFTVNFSTRHIYGTRIGAGTDRNWSY